MKGITPYGKDVVIKVMIAGIVMAVAAILIDNTFFRVILIALIAFLSVFTLYFFRDPERKVPDSYRQGALLSPADGKVVLIEKVVNANYSMFEKGEELLQISIFLSPLNVHVNRIPMTGKVVFLKYIEGDYLVAFDHKASERNERSEIGIAGEDGRQKVMFKQIAGFVARRIVYDLAEGKAVKAGERFGMIKFGSRVDMLMPADYRINVKIGDLVTAGETIIAEL